jgi:hypothetical protein
VSDHTGLQLSCCLLGLCTGPRLPGHVPSTEFPQIVQRVTSLRQIFSLRQVSNRWAVKVSISTIALAQQGRCADGEGGDVLVAVLLFVGSGGHAALDEVHQPVRQRFGVDAQIAVIA